MVLDLGNIIKESLLFNIVYLEPWFGFREASYSTIFLNIDWSLHNELVLKSLLCSQKEFETNRSMSFSRPLNTSELSLLLIDLVTFTKRCIRESRETFLMEMDAELDILVLYWIINKYFFTKNLLEKTKKSSFRPKLRMFYTKKLLRASSCSIISLALESSSCFCFNWLWVISAHWWTYLCISSGFFFLVFDLFNKVLLSFSSPELFSTMNAFSDLSRSSISLSLPSRSLSHGL